MSEHLLYETLLLLTLPIFLSCGAWGLFLGVAYSRLPAQWNPLHVVIAFIMLVDLINFAIFLTWIIPKPIVIFDSQRIGPSVIGGLLLGWGLYQLLYRPYFPLQKAQIQSAVAPLYWVLFSVITGLTEEIIWRGFGVAQLRSLSSHIGLSIFLPVFVTSLLFGLYHFGQGLKGIRVTTLLGIIWAATYIATNDLTVVVTSHVAYNLCIRFWPRQAKPLKCAPR